MKILPTIQEPQELKELKKADLERLATEIRHFLLQNISQTGGHLASNLGAVELSIALHRAFNSPADKLIWDVGHQAYVHKILTGRQEAFESLRQYNGLSGFLKRKESSHDIFEAGHSSTSISAAIGIAKANALTGSKDQVVAIIGDGALTGGMAFEAMNHAGHIKEKVIIVLNDNDMSIDENVGGMSTYLSHIRTNGTYYKIKGRTERTISSIPNMGVPMVSTLKRLKNSVKSFFVPGMLFEDLGLTYIGPVDGHNLTELHSAFELSKQSEKSCVVHVITKKGKGYVPAEVDPDKFHGVSPFKVHSGEAKTLKKEGYSNTFGNQLTTLAKENDKLVVITAAMCSGSGLCVFKRTFPERFVDVGIAEQHAVTMAAGLAISGLKPVFSVYSTFLQRAYDQVLHDVCIQNLPVLFAIDRAGLVGQDGETHHGVFDISYLSHMPHMRIYASKDASELKAMLEALSVDFDGPAALRFPRGDAKELSPMQGNPLEPQLEWHEGEDYSIFAVGSMFETALAAANLLSLKGIKGRIINPRRVHPIDYAALRREAGDTLLWVSLEDHVAKGGFGEALAIASLDAEADHRILRLSLPNAFMPHGSVSELHELAGLSPGQVAQRIEEAVQYMPSGVRG